MSRTVLLLLCSQLVFIVVDVRAAEEDEQKAESVGAVDVGAAEGAGGIEWHDVYGDAMRVAKAQQKMMFVWFHSAPESRFDRWFETVALRNAKVAPLLDRYIPVKLSTGARITVDGKEQRVLDHPAFQELNHSPGMAIIDFANPNTEHYGYVVTTLPFVPGKYYRFRPEHLAVALDLPAGTLTQRTLIFAVRIHPERPASTRGQIDPNLLKEAKSHSNYQATIRVQGHHHWGHRFPRLRRLLFGLQPQEIVAESWPQEGLVDAAVDVVDSWHHSSGHWQAVYSNQNRFGYDMKKGGNGIWYATGLFGNNR
ncbi:MAG TPA: hypothetical protein VFI31_14290 [Pirellulales bacterium]|nr:hypothetical protein [Pirellulales bacterium]